MDYRLRAKEIVSQMTPDEKIAQLSHSSKGCPRLGLPAYNWWNEGLHGVGRSGTATVFPQAIGLAAMFDINLLERIGDAVSDEFRAKYNEYRKHGDYGIYKGLTVWSPNINIFRDPRWGRGHETYGEDPFLTSRLAAAYIHGLQGNDPNYKKTDATLKHFAVHSGPEGERHIFDVKIKGKDLNETYLYSFKYCVDNANPSAVMGAYNAVNGEPCVTSHTLIGEILRDKWGFDGYFVSDCGAVCDLYSHRHVAASHVEAAAQALNAGCDLCCGIAYQSLTAAYDQGLVTDETLTVSAQRLVAARLKLGLGQETVYDNISYDVLACDAHRQLSLESALKSAILIKNNGILPLKTKNLTISVCGPNADSTGVLLGNYNGTPYRDITFLQGLQDALDGYGKVLYAQGCELTRPESAIGEWQPKFNTEALINASYADVVIACVGLAPQLEGEEGDAFNSDASGDRITMSIPPSQRELLDKLYATGKPVIVVNTSGSSVILGKELEKADALIQFFYPGELGGAALPKLLFGEVSPSGKLPVTFYASDDQLPDFKSYSMKGRTYRYFDGTPLIPFGFGLSYADITVSDARIDAFADFSGDDGLTGPNVEIMVSLTNSSAFACEEVVQIYSRRVADSGVSTPIFKLCGFMRVHCSASSMTNVIIEAISPFAFFNDEGIEEVLPGDYEIFAGTTQPDARSAELSGKIPACIKVSL